METELSVGNINRFMNKAGSDVMNRFVLCGIPRSGNARMQLQWCVHW